MKAQPMETDARDSKSDNVVETIIFQKFQLICSDKDSANLYQPLADFETGLQPRNCCGHNHARENNHNSELDFNPARDLTTRTNDLLKSEKDLMKLDCRLRTQYFVFCVSLTICSQASLDLSHFLVGH